MLDRQETRGALRIGHLQQQVGKSDWSVSSPIPEGAQLVLCFGPTAALCAPDFLSGLQAQVPGAAICGCSTGHAIVGERPRDDMVSAVALGFSHSTIRVAGERLENALASADCGRRLAAKLAAPDLSLVIVLSEGLHVNGDTLVRHLSQGLAPGVRIIGGLAGDGPAFEKTVVLCDGDARSGHVVAIGIYGNRLRVGHGYAGGWNVFGPERRITSANGAVLHEIDGEPALDLYERYLGEEAKGLPGAALLYPLQIWDPKRSDPPVVRTILSIDQDKRTMTFACDIPTGWRAQLMVGYQEALIAGSKRAGDVALEALERQERPDGDVLALLISCVGRQLCLEQHTADEIEVLRQAVPVGMHFAGFYSYGEISTFGGSEASGLLNQTMTATYIWEAGE